MTMTFYLDEEETRKFETWKNSLPEIPIDVFGKPFQYIFKFRPTGLGIVKIVEREYDGEQLNLTDYSIW
jgi:hypothetical protein